jgi:hypothetical protein
MCLLVAEVVFRCVIQVGIWSDCVIAHADLKLVGCMKDPDAENVFDRSEIQVEVFGRYSPIYLLVAERPNHFII